MNTNQRFPLFPKDRHFSESWERFPEIEYRSHLIFAHAKGKIRAGCYFGEQRIITFDLGIVPEAIAAKGTSAVRDFAKERVDALIRAERERRDHRDRCIRELSREYELNVDGVKIRGLVKKDRDNGPFDNCMRLMMIEPYKISVLIHVRPQCSADCRMRIASFDEDGVLLRQEIERQEAALVTLYKKELRRLNRVPPHPLLAELRGSK